jgi:hypothetical protein
MTAPVASVTTPLMEPALDCARIAENIVENTNTNRNEKMLRVGVRIESLLRLFDF